MTKYKQVKTQCYCAFCKSPRTVYTEKSVRPRHVFWSFLFSLATSFIIWRDWNPKSLLFFVVALMVSEVFVKIRWRMHMTCRECGFDPVLYMKKPQQAAEQVKNFLDRRARDPAYLLRRPLSLPVRRSPPPKTSQQSLH